MSSSSLLCRSWGINHGEEEFLGPVAMVTFAWCSADCPHCYLAESTGDFVQINIDTFCDLIEDMRGRGARAIFLVNPERQVPALTVALSRLRAHPHRLPVIVKLGGHEDPDEIEPLLSCCDACSLDVKAFSAEAAERLGCPDLPARTAGLAALVADRLGDFRRTDGVVSGWWVRHVGLPGMIDGLEGSMRRFFGARQTPVWFSAAYRPFNRARRDPRLNRKLSVQERLIMGELVQKLRMEGWPAWLR